MTVTVTRTATHKHIAPDIARLCDQIHQELTGILSDGQLAQLPHALATCTRKRLADLLAFVKQYKAGDLPQSMPLVLTVADIDFGRAHYDDPGYFDTKADQRQDKVLRQLNDAADDPSLVARISRSAPIDEDAMICYAERRSY